MDDATIIYRCSKCDRLMEIPKRYSGAQQTCRRCKTTFTVPKETDWASNESATNSKRSPVGIGDRHPCHFCAELIQPEARICPFCRKEQPLNRLDAAGMKMQDLGCAVTKAGWGCGCLFLILAFLYISLFS